MVQDWAAERRRMVERQLRRRGIRDKRVLRAMGRIAREEFLPPESRPMAYDDEPQSIGHAQTISQPYMTALMAELLELAGGETVLEVGAGSGYAAAVLGALAARVISIEIVPELAAQAARNLERTGHAANVRVVAGDGSMGWLEAAPYAAISVAAAAPDIPTSLLAQLADPGRLVIPVGSFGDQELLLLTRRGGRVDRRSAALCRFVPLRGGEGWR